MDEFNPFPKIGRLSNETVIITEKLDGTNAQVVINGDQIRAGSRNRWITPEDDNFGFARWVETNRTELLKLGDGQHFGEWWGRGIQRGYDLTERRFSLFNHTRWWDAYGAMMEGRDNSFPKCCSVVPKIAECEFDLGLINHWLHWLLENGSQAAHGFPDPEGIIIYAPKMRQMWKRTERDEPKGQKE
jgi:hypothetical protein